LPAPVHWSHLLVAVRVAEGGDGTPADMLLDTDGFAVLVINEINRGQLHE
jgi:hypothetical protein